jgi:fucose permease
MPVSEQDQGKMSGLLEKRRLTAIVCVGMVLLVAFTLAGSHVHFLVLPPLYLFFAVGFGTSLLLAPNRRSHRLLPAFPAFSPRPPPIR